MSSNLTPSATLSPTDAAWLAGYIDGDGCICLHRISKRYRSVLVVIDSADKEILDHVLSVTGKGFLVSKPVKKANHRQCHSWRLCGMQNVINLLQQVLPYLRCADKKARADLIVKEWKLCTPRNGFYTEDGRKLKEDFEARFLAIGHGHCKRITAPLYQSGP